VYVSLSISINVIPSFGRIVTLPENNKVTIVPV
jgi:hypothetical protein